MDIICDKYYKGYEGEPEIQFIEELAIDQKKIISIWSGYFDDIMNIIKPTDAGWKGIALYYHLYTGWYEESPWQLVDIEEALAQFQQLDRDKLTFEKSKYLLQEICDLLQESVDNKKKIWIALE